MTALMGCSFGATYTITNGSGATAFGIGNSSGDGFQGLEGVAAVGTFSSLDFNTFTQADFVTNFSAYGSPGFTNFRTAGVFGNNGTFTYTPGGVVGGSSFDGQAMLVLVGNADTFANSTEFLVLDLGRNFSAADDAIATPQTVAITDSTSVLFGGTVGNIVTFNGDVSTNQGFITSVPVPEPSIALLGGLGVLGLLRRSRRV